MLYFFTILVQKQKFKYWYYEKKHPFITLWFKWWLPFKKQKNFKTTRIKILKKKNN